MINTLITLTSIKCQNIRGHDFLLFFYFFYQFHKYLCFNMSALSTKPMFWFGYNFSKLSDTKHFPFHRSLFFLSLGQFRQGFHNWMPTELPLCPFILWILFWKSLFTIYEQEVPFILQKTLPGRASPESKTITAYPEQNLNTLY